MCAQKTQVFTCFSASLLEQEIALSEFSSKPLRTYAHNFVDLEFEKLWLIVRFQEASCKTHASEANVLKTQCF